MTIPATRALKGLASPDDWARDLARAPLVDVAVGRSRQTRLRRWQGTDPDVDQPALDAHYVVVHLGGAKRIRRTGEGASLVSDVASGAITIVPEGAAYAWNTQGPIDYAHFYVSPAAFEHAAETTFDRDGRGVAPIDRIGGEDPVLLGLFQAMLDEAASPLGEALYIDTLGEAFIGRLLRDHSNLPPSGRRAPYALAPRRLAEVIGFIEANLAQALTLDDLAAVAKLSRYHFSRAFARATGLAPHAFVVGRRLDAAKALLRATSLPIEDVARRCGFRGASHFAARFRRATGASPSDYRRDR